VFQIVSLEFYPVCQQLTKLLPKQRWFLFYVFYIVFFCQFTALVKYSKHNTSTPCQWLLPHFQDSQIIHWQQI